MKKIIFAALAVFFFKCGIAQTKPSDYVSFSVGATVPVGSFAIADAGTFPNKFNNTSGFAKTGLAFGFEGAHYVFSRWSIKGSLYFSEHGGINSKDVVNIAQSYQNAFGVDQAAVSTTNTYKSLNVMVGPSYSLPLGKLTIDAWVFGGIIASLSTPEIDVVLTDAGINYPFTQKSSTASAFGWQAGIGGRYKLSNRLSLLVKGDYFSSSGIKVDNTNRVNNAGRLVTNQPLSWVNITTGIAMSLERSHSKEKK
jgi:hypothetical protein